jgi:adenylate cyclase
LGGEEREITILMSDLRGFTATAARLSPHQVIEFLNVYFEAMVDVISRYEGTIDEIIGDGLLVIFGAPASCEDHAGKAVACGLAMQLGLKLVNEELAARGAPELEMGIGIHSGRVIVGNVGSLRRTKYAAVGSNVNLAGRIESFTTGGQVLISESTREKLQAELRIDGEFQVEPKGAASSVRLYEIGGIGSPYDLSLPAEVHLARAVDEAVVSLLHGPGGEVCRTNVYAGRLTAVCEREASMASEAIVPRLSNVRLELEATQGANPRGEIYAKVIRQPGEGGGQTVIRYTSVTPELKSWMRKIAGEPQALTLPHFDK